MAKLETADARRGNARRKITLRGKPLNVASDADPLSIARAIFKSSAAGKRELRLQEAEAKLGLRR